MGFPFWTLKRSKDQMLKTFGCQTCALQTVVINVSLGVFPMITFLKGFGNIEMGENMEEVIYPILLK